MKTGFITKCFGVSSLISMRKILLPGAILFQLTNCKPIPESEISGVPTEFYGNQNLDLTTFKNATPVDYHNMLKFLNSGSPKKITMENLISEFPRNLIPKSKYSPLSKIPIEELIAIRKYTGNYYSTINQPLWSLKDKSKILLVGGIVKSAAAGLNKIPNFIGPVIRGSTLPQVLIDSRYKPGTVISEKSFLSTSFRKSFSGNIRYLLHSKTGKRVDWISNIPGESEVIFTPGNYFYVHSIEKRERSQSEMSQNYGGISDPGEFYSNPSMENSEYSTGVNLLSGTGAMQPSQSYENNQGDDSIGGGQNYKTNGQNIEKFNFVVLEQIFPDSDTSQCCSLDEQWDTLIKACRYKTDGKGAPIFPYSVPAYPEGFEPNKCSSGSISSFTEWNLQKKCAAGKCYQGFPSLNMYSEDFQECRSGKKISIQDDFQKLCLNISPQGPAPYVGNYFESSGQVESSIKWNALISTINYDSKNREVCKVYPDRVDFSTMGQSISLPLKTLAKILKMPQLENINYWNNLKGSAAAVMNGSPHISRSREKNLKAGKYFYASIFGSHIKLLYSHDYNIETDGRTIDLISFEKQNPILVDYRKTILKLCNHLQNIL